MEPVYKDYEPKEPVKGGLLRQVVFIYRCFTTIELTEWRVQLWSLIGQVVFVLRWSLLQVPLYTCRIYICIYSIYSTIMYDCSIYCTFVCILYMNTLFPLILPPIMLLTLKLPDFSMSFKATPFLPTMYTRAFTAAYRRSAVVAIAMRSNITLVPPTDDRSVLISFGVKIRTPELPTKTAPGIVDGPDKWTAMFERNLTRYATLSHFKTISLAMAATNREMWPHTQPSNTTTSSTKRTSMNTIDIQWWSKVTGRLRV